MSTERPILFKGPLVRAILREVDPKTQTRRLITRLRGFGKVREFGRSDTPGYDWTFRDRRGLWNDISDKRLREVLPYQVGDHLWAREPWWRYVSTEIEMAAFQGGTITRLGDHGGRFEANDTFTPVDYPHVWTKRSSIHMPRWASRIDLEITEVRVQRLQDITEEDAQAEGVSCGYCLGKLDGTGRADFSCSRSTHRARDWFAGAWDAINGKRASWASNPWVWVVTFRRVRP